MIEQEQIILKKPGLLITGFVFSLLGLATPFLVYLAIGLIIPTPRPGEDHTPGDGLGMMLIMIGGILWWTFTELLSFGFTISGVARRETGRIKIPAIVAAVWSLILIVSVYIGAFALWEYNKREVERRYATQKL